MIHTTLEANEIWSPDRSLLFYDHPLTACDDQDVNFKLIDGPSLFYQSQGTVPYAVNACA